ncbi:MAG: DUF1329 domain-containing protein [Alphaproteobacteria bacterium]
MSWKPGIAVVTGLALSAYAAFAAAPPEEANRLGYDLTPVGAERAGNAAGTIPAWDGGLTGPPPGIGYELGKHYADPYAGDKALYAVRADNMAQYENQLTDTHRELLKAYPDSYYLNVYPSRRSCAYPEFVYKASRSNALSGQLSNDGEGITGAVIAAPFPIPQSGREVLWNHVLRYQGHKVTLQTATATPTRNGQYSIETAREQLIFAYSDPQITRIEDINNVQIYYMRHGLTPLKNAGTIQVMHNTLDQIREKRRGWYYEPGARKVRPVVGAEFDNVIPSSEGILFNDAYYIFNGSGELYDWELTGKQEKLIPYNTFRLGSPEVKYADILHKLHLNQEPIRYELHRVWVIEGKLKPGKRHHFATRRKIYIDEDSWTGVAAVLHDDGGELTRVQEAHIINYYDQPLCSIRSNAIYDISGGRYNIIGLDNEEAPIKFELTDSPDAFSAEGVRRLGVR